MDASQPNASRARSVAVRLAAVVGVAGTIALAVLIAGELFPHHAAPHALSGEVAPATVPTDPMARPSQAAPRPSARQVASIPAAASPTPDAPPAKAKAPAVPLAAAVIAQVAAHPEAFAPSTVFAPPAADDQVYSYEPLPPFNSTTLKRTRKNPAAWELDAMHGPKMSDLGPEGAVRQAALVKDSIGNETPWYAIDSGPLAPAFAVMQGGAMRVMSRAFLVANRLTLPPEVASALGN